MHANTPPPVRPDSSNPARGDHRRPWGILGRGRGCCFSLSGREQHLQWIMGCGLAQPVISPGCRAQGLPVDLQSFLHASRAGGTSQDFIISKRPCGETARSALAARRSVVRRESFQLAPTRGMRHTVWRPIRRHSKSPVPRASGILAEICRRFDGHAAASGAPSSPSVGWHPPSRPTPT